MIELQSINSSEDLSTSFDSWEALSPGVLFVGTDSLAAWVRIAENSVMLLG